MGTRLGGLENRLGDVETRLQKGIKAGADVQGGMAERFALLERRIAGVDQQPRRPQLLTSGATVAAAAAAATAAAGHQCGLCFCGAAGPASALDSDPVPLLCVVRASCVSPHAAACMRSHDLPAGPLAAPFPRASTPSATLCPACCAVDDLLRICSWFNSPWVVERQDQPRHAGQAAPNSLPRPLPPPASFPARQAAQHGAQAGLERGGEGARTPGGTPR